VSWPVRALRRAAANEATVPGSGGRGEWWRNHTRPPKNGDLLFLVRRYVFVAKIMIIPVQFLIDAIVQKSQFLTHISGIKYRPICSNADPVPTVPEPQIDAYPCGLGSGMDP